MGLIREDGSTVLQNMVHKHSSNRNDSYLASETGGGISSVETTENSKSEATYRNTKQRYNLNN